MNRGLTPDQLGGLLDEVHLATVSTFRKDGTVLLSPVWYAWEDHGFTFVLSSTDWTVKHLEIDPRITVLVADDGFPYRGFEMRGTATFLGIPSGPVIRRIAERYVGPEAASFYDDEVASTVVRVESDQVRGWDFRDDLAEMGLI